MHYSKTKANARDTARRYRNKGYACSIYKMKSGYGVSVKRK